MNKKLPFIKVCGQTHAGTVDASLALGARYVGFIFHRSSPRSITAERAAAIHTRFASRVGVFVRQRAEEIVRIMQIAQLNCTVRRLQKMPKKSEQIESSARFGQNIVEVWRPYKKN